MRHQEQHPEHVCGSARPHMHPPERLRRHRNNLKMR
jgi:hypothetical protein